MTEISRTGMMIDYPFREPGNYKTRMWIPNFTPSTWPAIAYIMWNTAIPFLKDTAAQCPNYQRTAQIINVRKTAEE